MPTVRVIINIFLEVIINVTVQEEEERLSIRKEDRCKLIAISGYEKTPLTEERQD